MAENAGDDIVRRHFEAYLLWLFGWVMFLSFHGDSVDKQYVRYAHELADLPVDEIPSYTWGPTVPRTAPSSLDARYFCSCGPSSASRLDDHS